MERATETTLECCRCGKEFDPSKGAYGLSLREDRPEYDRLHPGEDIIWSKWPYCSRECLEKSLNQIRGELISWLQEENWVAIEFLKRWREGKEHGKR